MNHLVSEFVEEMVATDRAVPKKYKKGHTIIQQGEKIERIYYLMEGSCYRKSLTSNGDEIIYDVRTLNSGLHRMIGILILYSDTKISTTTFVAKTDCLFYQIDEYDFIDYANAHPMILHELLRLSVNSYDSLNEKYHFRYEGKAANHLCEIILQNVHKENDELYAKVGNNTELASFIGIHRVSVVRILRQLEDMGVLLRTHDAKGLQIFRLDEIKAYANGKKFIYKK